MTIGTDNTIYVGANQSFFAINPNGTLKWTFKTAGFNSLLVPAITADNTVYLGTDYYEIGARSQSGRLYAFRSDGNLKWQFSARRPLTSPVIGVDGTIYVGSTDGLYAFNPEGKLKWKFHPNDLQQGVGLASPSIAADGTLYVGSWNYLYAVKRDGTQKWKFAAGIPMGTPTVSADGTLFVSSGNDRHLYAINPDGTVKWKFTSGAMGQINSSPAIAADGTIYFTSEDGKLYALGAAAGSQ